MVITHWWVRETWLHIAIDKLPKRQNNLRLSRLLENALIVL